MAGDRLSAAARRERHARAALSFLAEPGDPALGGLLRSFGPAEILAAVSAHRPETALPSATDVPGIGRALGRWQARLGAVPPPGRLDAWEDFGYRLVCPGDPEWPTQLDDLGDARPVVLWLRGTADLRYACLRSVSIVGARAATTYGTHVAAEMAAALADLGWTVISGGAFGIDASAHRGALAVGGRTVAVLAGGLAVGYPKGHHELFGAIGEHGVLVSECPPDQPPTRPGFLIRNRLIAALSPGTVVVEAALRSGALSTARHAREINRLVMAVPGPVTSEQSAGCHELIREYGTVLVAGARDVAELIGPVGGGRVELAGCLDTAAPGIAGAGMARARAAGSGAAGPGAAESGAAESGAAESGTAEYGVTRSGIAGSEAAGSCAAGAGPAGPEAAGSLAAGPTAARPGEAGAGTARHASAATKHRPGQPSGAGPVLPADDLDPVTAAVLRATPSRAGRGPAAIATIARVDLDTALRCLGLLAAAGHVERCPNGWRASSAR